MLPPFLKKIFYKILRSGPVGRFVADVISWFFYWGVKIFRVPPQKDVAGLVIISHRYKFIFFGIPKVATRSFFNALVKQNSEVFEIEWSERRDGFFDAVRMCPDYYKFSFVRNPWSRILSCYNSKIADNIIGKRARILSFYKGIKGGDTFENFARWLNSEEGRDGIADRHWLSQYVFLHDEAGNALCDYVGRYETLNEDWVTISKTLNLPTIALPQKGYVSAEGKTRNPEGQDVSQLESTKRLNYKEHYTDETWALIETRYKKDIEMFKYDDER